MLNACEHLRATDLYYWTIYLPGMVKKLDVCLRCSMKFQHYKGVRLYRHNGFLNMEGVKNDRSKNSLVPSRR